MWKQGCETIYALWHFLVRVGACCCLWGNNIDNNSTVALKCKLLATLLHSITSLSGIPCRRQDMFAAFVVLFSQSTLTGKRTLSSRVGLYLSQQCQKCNRMSRTCRYELKLKLMVSIFSAEMLNRQQQRSKEAEILAGSEFHQKCTCSRCYWINFWMRYKGKTCPRCCLINHQKRVLWNSNWFYHSQAGRCILWSCLLGEGSH